MTTGTSNKTRSSFWAALIVIAAVAILVESSSARRVPISLAGSMPLDPNELIVRHLQKVIPSASSGDTDPYQYIADTSITGAISHSGSQTVMVPQSTVYQHIYAFSEQNVLLTDYDTTNSAGHVKDFLLNPALHRRSLVEPGNLNLVDGSLLVSNKNDGSQAGLLASFNVEVLAEISMPTRANPDRTVTRKLLAGSVEVVGLRNGKVVIRTRGAIKRQHIVGVSSDTDPVGATKLPGRKFIRPADIAKVIRESNGLIKIDLSDLELALRKFWAWEDKEFTITTLLTSNINTLGENSGAEVIFMPQGTDPMISGYHQSGQVPEPATIMLMVTGGILAFGRKSWSRKKTI